MTATAVRNTQSTSLGGGLAVSRGFGLQRRRLNPQGYIAHVCILEDGLCSVQVYLVAPATVGHVSPAEVKRGAEAVFETCVVGRSLGGLASDLGTGTAVIGPRP